MKNRPTCFSFLFFLRRAYLSLVLLTYFFFLIFSHSFSHKSGWKMRDLLQDSAFQKQVFPLMLFAGTICWSSTVPGIKKKIDSCHWQLIHFFNSFKSKLARLVATGVGAVRWENSVWYWISSIHSGSTVVWCGTGMALATATLPLWL